jgi:hypothetical protein
VPLVMKEIVDSLDARQAVLALPFALLVIYGVLRLSNTLFAELRDIVFVRVAKRAIRRVARRCSATCTRCRCGFTWNARPAECRATLSAARAAFPRC